VVLCFVAACSQPAPPDREDSPSEEVVLKKPDCRVDLEDASPPEAGVAPSTLNEEERRNVYRAVHELRERARQEAQQEFPTPEARGIAGPGQVEKELAVQSARSQQAESLERYYLGRLALDRQLELRRAFADCS
jgi:hypothetical protein